MFLIFLTNLSWCDLISWCCPCVLYLDCSGRNHPLSCYLTKNCMNNHPIPMIWTDQPLIIFPLIFHHSPPLMHLELQLHILVALHLQFLLLWLPVCHFAAFSKVVPDPIIRPKMLSTWRNQEKIEELITGTRKPIYVKERVAVCWSQINLRRLNQLGSFQNYVVLLLCLFEWYEMPGSTIQKILVMSKHPDSCFWFMAFCAFCKCKLLKGWRSWIMEPTGRMSQASNLKQK